MNVIRPMRGPLRYPVTFPLVVVLLVVSVLAPTACVPRVPESASRTAKLPERKPTGAERFAKATDELTGALALAASKLESGSKATTEVAAIAEFADALPGLDKGVRADFAKTRKILAKVDSAEKDAIQAKVEKQYAKRLKTLKSKLADIEDADTPKATATAVASLASWMDEITPDEPHQPLGTELPHRIVDYDAGPPTLGTQIAPAYAPNLADSVPSTLPVTPTSEDLTQTIEVQFTDDIRSLATSLGSDPVKMYEYVRNTIDFEPYYGSRKGANETLAQLSGNDMDQASLLIALYRASGIPARYVSGVVDVPIDKAMNWVGVEVPEAAAKLFASAGTPTTSLVSGGKVKALRIEHTWVEAYVPYEDYRGEGSGTGEKLWVPLDPSFKAARRSQAQPVLPVGSSMATADVLRSSASVSADSGIAVCNTQVIEARIREVSIEASRQVALLSAESRSDRLRRSRVSEYERELPVSLAVRIVCITGERTELPPRSRESLSVAFGDAVVDLAMPALDRKKVSLGFVYACDADQQVALTYDEIGEVPAYLVQIRPAIFVEDRLAATGAPSRLGDACLVRLAARVGESESFTSSDRLVLGGWHDLAVDLGRPSRQARERRLGELNSTLAVLASRDSSGTVARAMTGVLHDVGRVYFEELGALDDVLSEASGVRVFRLTSVALSGTSASVGYLLGIPAGVVIDGLYLDVDADRVVAASIDGLKGSCQAYLRASGLLASLLESDIFEQIFDGSTAVSAAAVLANAMESGVRIRQFGSWNAEEVLRTLRLGDTAVSEIRAAVSAGMWVTCPEEPITLGGWRGAAWIVEDPETGSLGCMIAEGAPLGGARLALGLGTNLPELLTALGYLITHAALIVGPMLGGAEVAVTVMWAAATLVPSVALTIFSFVKCLEELEANVSNYNLRTAAVLQASTLFVHAMKATVGLGIGSNVPTIDPEARQAMAFGAHVLNLFTTLHLGFTLPMMTSVIDECLR